MSFSATLNYNPRKDFVININDVRKFLKYGRMSDCKYILIKNFKEGIDYKIDFAAEHSAAKKEKRGIHQQNETSV